MEKQNITLSLPRVLLKKARHLAVEKNTSLSGLLSEYLRIMVSQDEASRRATSRITSRLKAGLDLGTGGRTAWIREDLHER